MESALIDLAPESGYTAQRARILAIAAVAIIAAAAAVLLSVPDTALRLAPLALAGLAVIGWVVVLASRDPRWLVGALLTVAAVSETNLVEGIGRASAHYVIIFALCLPAIPKVLRSGALRYGGFRLYCLYYLWALATVAYSLAPVFSAGRLAVSVSTFLALSFAATTVNDCDDAKSLMEGFAAGCGIVTTLLVASLVLLPHNVAWAFHPEWGVERFEGFLSQPNQIGEVTVTTLGAALFLWSATTGKVTKLGLAILILAIAGLDIVADSRTSFVSIGVGCTAYVIWRYRWRGVLACAALAACLAVAAALLFSDLRTYLVHRDVTTLTGRTDMWRFVVREIRERPLLGYGYGVEGMIFKSRYFPLWWGPWQQGAYSSLHNGYLDMMISVGIPAAALWFYTLLRPFVFMFRRREDPWKLKPLALLVMIPILVENLAESTTQDWRAPVGILLFLAWALAERQRMMVIGEDARLLQERLSRLPPALSIIGD
jgi:O-antigen ligase